MYIWTYVHSQQKVQYVLIHFCMIYLDGVLCYIFEIQENEQKKNKQNKQNNIQKKDRAIG